MVLVRDFGDGVWLLCTYVPDVNLVLLGRDALFEGRDALLEGRESLILEKDFLVPPSV
jgi:hypothetical protein